MELSPDLAKHREVAQRYLAEGRITDTDFSGPTYQLGVRDMRSEEPVWVFLQLDQDNSIRDGFCSCEVEDEAEYCEHMVAAYLALFDEGQPLHQRFADSLWKELSLLSLEKVGDNPSKLTEKPKGTYWKTPVILSGRTKAGKEKLHRFLKERQVETEENSLKFSNLSAEELADWHSGDPTPDLRYELSYWSDIAKWWQGSSDAKVKFEGKKGELPASLSIEMRDLLFTCKLTRADWPRIIRRLNSADSPLSVFEAESQNITKITFSPEQRTFFIEHEQGNGQLTGEQGIEVDGWLFVPEKGFFSQESNPLLSRDRIESPYIPEALLTLEPVLRRYLPQYEIKSARQATLPHLYFDEENRLHIDPFLFSPGDLSSFGAQQFGEWSFIPGKGFYRLQVLEDGQECAIIPPEEIAEFVTLNRTWLNTVEGFHTHLASVETGLTYSLTDDNHLLFNTELDASRDTSERTIDFGRWLYIETQGFFTKKKGWTGSFLGSGHRPKGKEISAFIKRYRDDLRHVPDFFSPVCPIQRAVIDLRVEEADRLKATPRYEMAPGYEDRGVRILHDVAYIPNEGFYELPAQMILPEKYAKPQVITSRAIPVFLGYELDRIIPYLGNVDSRVQYPNRLGLSVKKVVTDAMQSLGTIKLELEYVSEIGRYPVGKVWQAIQEKKRYLFTEAGLLELDSVEFGWLHRINPQRVHGDKNTVTLTTLDLLRLSTEADLQLDIKRDRKQKKLHQLLTEMEIKELPDLNGLTSVLRPYQETGLRWLWFLYRYRLSGLLCDDMGLGKTHQAMALMAGVKNYHIKKEIKKPPLFLVVCPTSVLFHWQDKLEEFLPHLKVKTFYGPQRSLKDDGEGYDVLLTSYGVLRREAKRIARLRISLAIYDEVQIAKNSSSRVHKALEKVGAQMRLGLTGTPIENKLKELKSLFDIVLPTYMPGDSAFRDLFVNPIEKQQDDAARALLAKFIRPFILRRKKEDVLPELPVKTEEVGHCALRIDQERLYEEVLHQSARKLIKELEQGDTPVPFVHIFALLTMLKQVCNHPALYLKDVKRYQEYHSGKWDLFVELLNEARASGQKVVVFSHFLGMMDIIEMHLKAQGVNYASVRGSTTDRRKEIERFQKDPECEVFVGSLQAVGLGIDLTAASVVIHYDRWWNPAREDQATDRVHRIGQQRGVQVFKLVTKDTLEERIDELINEKKKLAEGVIGVEDESIVKSFDREELLSLLKHIHTVDFEESEDV